MPVFERLVPLWVLSLHELCLTRRDAGVIAVMRANHLNLIHPYGVVRGRLTDSARGMTEG